MRWLLPLCRLALRLYPRGFRERHGDALLATVETALRADAVRRPALIAALRGIHVLLNLLGGAVLERLRALRTHGSTKSGGRPMRPELLLHEFRGATRALLRAPAHAAVATLTLALGVGACVALFSIMNAVVLRPLPFDEPDELVHLWTHNASQGTERYVVSPMALSDLRERSTAFEQVAGYYRTQYALTGGEGEPERLRAYLVTWDFFAAMGVRPLVGRTFTEADGTPGAEAVVVVSEGYWRRRFGGDTGLVGSTILLNGMALEVVGIVRTAQTFPNDAQIWTQITFPLQIQGRGARWLNVVGRLHEGVGVEAGRRDMERIAAQLEREYPEEAGWGITVVDMRTALLGDARLALILLFGAAAVVLLVACANVAGMTLLRAQERIREMAVRASLGATRLRLALQLLAESLILSAGGAVIGIALAATLLAALPGVTIGELPRIEAITPDGAAALLATGCLVFTALVLGLAPAFQLGGMSLGPVLTESSRGSTGGRARARLRSVFVIAQVASAVVLVMAGVQLARSFERLLAIDPGFDPNGVVTMELDLQAGYADFAAAGRFYAELERRVAELPGVEAVGLTSSVPLADANDYFQTIRLPDAPVPPDEDPRAYLRQVSAGLLETLRIPVVEGRGFTPFDRADAAPVALVNEAFVRRYFPDGDPVGRTIAGLGYQIGPLGIIPAESVEIVGVIADVHYDDLRQPAATSIYFPMEQAPFRRMALAIRSGWSAEEAARAVRSVLDEMDPALPISGLATLGSRVDDALAADRRNLLLMGGFGSIALLLAGLGVFGIVAWSARQRVPEFGIRLALGASPGTLVRLVLRHALGLIAAGVILGLIATLPAMRVLASQLYGVSAIDPVALLVVCAVLVVMGILAGAIPAVRTTRMDPLKALNRS